mmetsp:Transcript_47992/g.94231  ORF Transcript_47992/g.94231 Transcript_47992/m.94231 type:complete len:424 (+) Transcript_47992:2-1273(+)
MMLLKSEAKISGISNGDCLPVVIDNGALTTTAGFAGFKSPIVCLSSLLANPLQEDFKGVTRYVPLNRNGTVSLQDADSNCYRYPFLVGDEVSEQALYRDLEKAYRVNPSVFCDSPNWTDLTCFWAEVFDKLGVDTSAHPVLLTQPVLAPAALREKTLAVMFEVFDVPACAMIQAPILTVFSYGQPTGLVIDIGESSTQVVPVFEGCVLEHACMRVKHICGAASTAQLLSNFNDSDFVLGRTQYEKVWTARDIKKRLVYTSSNYAADIEDELKKMAYHKRVKNKAGQDVDLWLHEELLRCGEMFFQPQLILDDADDSIISIQELVAQVVNKCDIDTREGLLRHVLLSGGVTEMKGFGKRLEQELKLLLPYAKGVIRVCPEPDRLHAVWRGGSVLGSSSVIEDMWVTQEKYFAEKQEKAARSKPT